MRPPIAYFGGKVRLAPRIVPLLEAIPHQHYVEPFCGSLAMLAEKRPVRHETVNDLDEILMLWWRVARDRAADLERVCALTPHSRREHQLAYEPVPDGHPDPDLERARRLWVQLTQGRAGCRTSTGWRHYQKPAGSTSSMPDYLDGYVSRIGPMAERLHRVSLECRDALDVIADYGRHRGVLLYCDPPYLGSTRLGGAEAAHDRNPRHARNSYAVEMQGETEHRELGAALRACRSVVVVSGYPCSLYDEELYPDWHRVEFATATGQGGTWADRIEVLWSNRPLGETTQLDLFTDPSEAVEAAS